MFPSCGRCIRLGFTCSYRDRISQRATQSAIISHLQERVRKQEALLALQSAANKPPSVTLMTTQAPSPSITSPSPHSGPSPSACVEKQRADSGAGSAMAEYNAAWFAGTTFDDSLGSMPTTIDWDMEIMSMRPDGAHITEDWLASTTSGQPLLSTPPAIIAAKDMDELHAIFFARIHPVMPIINEGQFRKDLQDSPHAVAVQSVSCTAALLATTVPEAQASLKQSCYVLARYYVDQCEAEEGFHPSWCMHFLRALLFLTRFEINNRSCARAWLTLGRAIRLAKIMRLDQIDCANEPLFPNVSLPEIVSPAAQTAVELEERRRCLWALYILEGLASIYTGTPGLLDESRVCRSKLSRPVLYTILMHLLFLAPGIAAIARRARQGFPVIIFATSWRGAYYRQVRDTLTFLRTSLGCFGLAQSHLPHLAAVITVIDIRFRILVQLTRFLGSAFFFAQNSKGS